MVSKWESSGCNWQLFKLHLSQEQKLDQSRSLAHLQHLEQCLPMVDVQQIFVELTNWVFGKDSFNSTNSKPVFSIYIKLIFSFNSSCEKIKLKWIWRTTSFPLNLRGHIPCWGNINLVTHRTTCEPGLASGKSPGCSVTCFFSADFLIDLKKSSLSAPQVYLL